jgi:hypothetical protein
VHHPYGDYEVCTSRNSMISMAISCINVNRKIPHCIDSLLQEWKVLLLRRDSRIYFR